MLSLIFTFLMLPFNPDYSVKGCSDNDIVILDEFQTILEYPNQIKPIFEDGSVKVRVSGSACRTYNAKVTVSFDIDENGKLVNYKQLAAFPRRVADRAVKRAIYGGKVIKSMYGTESIQVTVHYLQYKCVEP